jgi:hypothetical protein
MSQLAPAQGVVPLEPGEPIDRVYCPQSGMVSQLVVAPKNSTASLTTNSVYWFAVVI